jgi:hypothetical protein
MAFNFSDMDPQEDNGSDETNENIKAALTELLSNSNHEEDSEQESILSERQERILEARSRVEHANLYLTIIKNDLFAAGSANSEVQAKVEEEFKAFAGERLAQLLGMKSPEAQVVVKQESVFSEEEIKALKMLTSKIIPKTQAEPAPAPKVQPKINRIVVPESYTPRVNQVQEAVPQQTKTKAKAKPAPKAIKSETSTLTKPISEMSPQEARAELAKRSGTTAVGRSAQAPKPLPMPSFESQLAKAAMEVEMAARANPIVVATTKVK